MSSSYKFPIFLNILEKISVELKLLMFYRKNSYHMGNWLS